MNPPVQHRIVGRRQVLVIAVTLMAAARSVCADTVEEVSLLNSLRHGGYVLVMRHASSPRSPPEQSAAQPDNFNVERELDEIGRETAREMGEAIKHFKIPIGEIETSPTYRARQTLKLAGWSAPKNVSELGDGGQSMQADTEGSRSAWLHRHVRELPRATTNTLLVTHLPNISGAFGPQAAGIADGETLVFRPDGKGSTTLVARVKIQDWPHLDRKIP